MNLQSPNRLYWFFFTTIVAVCLAVVGAWAATTSQSIVAINEHQRLTDKAVIEINTKLDMLLMFSKHDFEHPTISPKQPHGRSN